MSTLYNSATFRASGVLGCDTGPGWDQMDMLWRWRVENSEQTCDDADEQKE